MRLLGGGLHGSLAETHMLIGDTMRNPLFMFNQIAQLFDFMCGAIDSL